MATPGLAAVSSPAFVGRAAELAEFERAIETAFAGRPLVILVSGEPGGGKSRFLAEAVARTESRTGLQRARGYALQEAAAPPYYPLSRAFGDLVRLPGVAAELGEHLPILAAAGLAGPQPAAAEPSRLGADEERLRLFESASELLACVARRGPLLLTLDDMQWAHHRAWELVAHAVRRLEGCPVALALAARESLFLEPPTTVLAVITELNRNRLVSRIQLKPLGDEAVGELLDRMLGGSAGPALRERVVTQSGGNPFFAEEVVADLLARDELLGEGGIWELRDAAGSAAPPMTLQLALGDRLERLPEGCEAVLAVAAVVGREFDDRTVATAHSDLEATSVALAAAAARGLVQRSGVAWSFRHDLVREVVLARAAARLRALHRAVAQALESADSTDAVERNRGFGEIAIIAGHWREAGDTVRGCEATVAASRAASRERAPDAALEMAREAHLAAGWLGVAPRDTALRFEAALRHGEAATDLGAFAEAEEAFRAALRTADLIGDRALQGAAWVRLGALYRRKEAPEQASGSLANAITLLDGTDSRDLAEALIELATLDGLTRARYEEAETDAARATAMARRLGDAALEARAVLAAGNTLARKATPAAARSLLEQAYERAVAGNDLSLAAEVAASLSNSYYWTGDLRAARRYAELRVEVAARGHDIFGLRHAHSWLALLACSRGEWEEARSLIRESETLLAHLASPEPIAFLRVVETLVNLRVGDNEAAYASGREAITLLEPVGDATVIWYAGLLVLACLATERDDEARREIARQETRIAALPLSALPARSARATLAFAYAALGDNERGAACEAALRPFAGDYHWSPVRRSLAALAALQGETSQALADLEAAEAQSRREDGWPDLALILLARAELLPPGTPARAEALREATSLVTTLGMDGEIARAEALAGTAAPRPRGANTLTAREVEIVRLVAAGKTNREIANELVISERTVINHVSHVFGKIGVENRSGATAWALREGLA